LGSGSVFGSRSPDGWKVSARLVPSGFPISRVRRPALPTAAEAEEAGAAAQDTPFRPPPAFRQDRWSSAEAGEAEAAGKEWSHR